MPNSKISRGLQLLSFFMLIQRTQKLVCGSRALEKKFSIQSVNSGAFSRKRAICKIFNYLLYITFLCRFFLNTFKTIESFRSPPKITLNIFFKTKQQKNQCNHGKILLRKLRTNYFDSDN